MKGKALAQDPQDHVLSSQDKGRRWRKRKKGRVERSGRREAMAGQRRVSWSRLFLDREDTDVAHRQMKGYRGKREDPFLGCGVSF